MLWLGAMGFWTPPHPIADPPPYLRLILWGEQWDFGPCNTIADPPPIFRGDAMGGAVGFWIPTSLLSPPPLFVGVSMVKFGPPTLLQTPPLTIL